MEFQILWLMQFTFLICALRCHSLKKIQLRAQRLHQDALGDYVSSYFITSTIPQVPSPYKMCVRLHFIWGKVEGYPAPKS